jgi:hypothetical protein
MKNVKFHTLSIHQYYCQNNLASGTYCLIFDWSHCQKCPFLLFMHSCSIYTPRALLWIAKHLGFSVVNHLTCCFAILILVLQCKHSCSKNKCSTQMHTSKLWLLRMRKVKAPTWMKLLSTKNYINGPKLRTKFISPWV